MIYKLLERFHSRDQHLCKFIRTKQSVYIRKEYSSQKICLGYQHGRHFIVLEHRLFTIYHSVDGVGKWFAKFSTGKLRPGIAFTICSNQFHVPKKGCEGLKLVSKMALKEWNTNFRSEYSIRKNRTTLSDVLLLPKIFREIRLESTEHHFLCLPNGKICLVYNTCGYFASCVVFFQAPQGVRKNTSNGRNVRSYYMLNHRIRGLLFHQKKELLLRNWLPLFLVRVFRNILIPCENDVKNQQNV